MDRMQRQSILIVLGSLEQQISSLRNLVMIGSDDEIAVKTMKTKVAAAQALGYTSDDEDESIKAALHIDKAEQMKETFLQELAEEARRGINE